MSLRSVGRIFPGFALVGSSSSGGGGGPAQGADFDIVVGANLIAGDTEITHTLGGEPELVAFNNATGQTIVLNWTPKVGSESTVIVVSSFAIQNNVTLQLSKAGTGGGATFALLTSQNLIAGVTEITHALGSEPEFVAFNDSDGQSIIVEWTPKVGSESTVIEVTSFAVQNNVAIQLSVST